MIRIDEASSVLYVKPLPHPNANDDFTSGMLLASMIILAYQFLQLILSYMRVLK